MNIKTKEIKPYTLIATIDLNAEELAKSIQDVRKEIAQEATIQGFRKGKAPQHLVDQRMSDETVRAEALEHAVENSFSNAVAQEHWDIRTTSDLKVERNDKAGLRYSVQVHLWPPVQLPDLNLIRVSRSPVEVTDAEIDEALDTVRNMRATFLDKTEAATMGDRVELDFESSLNEKPVEGGSSQNHPLVIGGKSFMPGFEEELIGLKAGDTKQFSLTAPNDYHAPALAGKKLDFSVTIKRVQSVLKPPADDAFAKSLGNFSGLAQLKDSIRTGLASEKKAKEQQRVRLAVLEAIIAKEKIPAPEEMVKVELDDMVHRFSHDLQHRGIEFAMYLARMKKTEDDIKKDWTPEAQKQVRIMLVLREVAKQHHIAVAPEELDQAFQATAAELMQQGQQGAQLDPQRLRTMLAERMLTDRALEYLERTCAV